MSTTRWIDTLKNDLDSAINELIDEVKLPENANVFKYVNYAFEKAFEINQKAIFDNSVIMYNLIHYSYDQILTQVVGTFETQTTTQKKGFIIVYESNQINYIINKKYDAQKFLRRLLNYTGKNEIVKNSSDLDTNFFYWLISRVYNSQNTFDISDQKTITAKFIKGIKGDVSDLQTRVAADGESVISIISTLAFLLESNNLKQVKVDLSYENCETGESHENISLILQKDTINIDLSSYQGIYEHDNDDEKIAKLYLLIYLDIFPNLLQEYYADIYNELWSKSILIEFLESVANTIQSKVDRRIGELASLRNDQNNERADSSATLQQSIK